MVAHEYAHNLQHELGFFARRPLGGNAAFELQADCLAGVWANSVYRAGQLEPGDVEEAQSTALAVGDFEFANAQHHGTPERAARRVAARLPHRRAVRVQPVRARMRSATLRNRRVNP